MFPALVTNDTGQISVICRELNNTKPALINGKLLNILGVINLNKISNWDYTKGKSLWVNVNFGSLENVKKQFIFPSHLKRLQ